MKDQFVNEVEYTVSNGERALYTQYSTLVKRFQRFPDAESSQGVCMWEIVNYIAN